MPRRLTPAKPPQGMQRGRGGCRSHPCRFQASLLHGIGTPRPGFLGLSQYGHSLSHSLYRGPHLRGATGSEGRAAFRGSCPARGVAGLACPMPCLGPATRRPLATTCGSRMDRDPADLVNKFRPGSVRCPIVGDFKFRDGALDLAVMFRTCDALGVAFADLYHLRQLQEQVLDVS